jgi:choline dehydrogenase-like flavoprotein
MRAKLKQLFKDYKVLFIKSAEKNEMLAHVCGTCKMGVDPKTSVVDTNNRLHGFENVYVLDSSFFPTSGGTNPALTIAANSLRVAEFIIAQEIRNRRERNFSL